MNPSLAHRKEPGKKKGNKFVVTACLSSTSAQAPQKIVWDTSQPLPLGHPFKWVLEKTETGIRIRSIAFELNKSKSQTVKEVPDKDLLKGGPINLPSSGKSNIKSLTWIRLQEVQSLPAAFELSNKSAGNNLHVFSCVGNYIQDCHPLTNGFEARAAGKSLFNVQKSSKGFTLNGKIAGLELLRGKTKTPIQGKSAITLTAEELSSTKVKLGSMTWSFNGVLKHKLNEKSQSPLGLIDQIDDKFYRKTIRSVSTAFAALLIAIVLWPVAEVPEEEKNEVIPAQYTKVVLSKLKPKAPSAAPAAGALSKKPVKAAKQTKVAKAFRTKALRSAVSGLLKGGMTRLMAESDLVSASRKSGKLFTAKNKDLTKGSALAGMESGKAVKVSKLGGPGGTKGGVGYGEGKRAGVSGQGTSFVALDTGGSFVEKGLSQEEVGKVIHAHMKEIRYCYESSILRSPNVQGKLVVDFTIGGLGRVSQSSVKQSTLADPRLDDCILRRLARWKFPKPRGKVDVAVSYPFIFKSIGR